MRAWFVIAALVVTQFGAAWATGAAGVDRPGGTFSTLEADNAAACARLCEEDRLCLAWSHHGNACELKAIAPQAVANAAMTSGLSSRASAQIQRMTELRPAPAVPIAIASNLPTPALEETEDAPAIHADDALLGGMDDEDLRARLGEAAVR